jgi:excinuclease ABC subunit B
LRSETSIVQMIGRAARHINATVILYADSVTPAMAKAMEETTRRRKLQVQYNTEHGLTPQSVRKAIRSALESEVRAHRTVRQAIHASDDEVDRTELIRLLEEEMLQAAKSLEFERAAQLRDKLAEIKGAPLIAGAAAPVPRTPGIWEPRSKGRSKRPAK